MLTLVDEVGSLSEASKKNLATLNLDPLVFTQAQPLTQAHDDTSGDQ
ncbi:hypothetical protein [Pseudomonas phage GP100]|nr:hypothetical protein [Pseudomonas phage GP100]